MLTNKEIAKRRKKMAEKQRMRRFIVEAVGLSSLLLMVYLAVVMIGFKFI